MKLVNTSVNSSIILQRDAAAFAYKKEAFLLKSANGCLYIKGSDDHGLAYGILEVSRLLGVSPWEWWADAKPKQLKAFSLKEDITMSRHHRWSIEASSSMMRIGD